LPCPKCRFKNLENIENNSKKYLLIKSRKNLALIFKVILILFAIIGISGTVNANFSGNSGSHNLKNQIAQNGTVYIESGFSGAVKVKDVEHNQTTNINVNYKPSSSGTGVIVTKNGYIITAFHVVSDPDVLEKNEKLKKMKDNDIKWYVEKEALKDYITKNPQLGYKLLNKSKNSKINLTSDKNMNYITKSFIKNGWISANSWEYNIYVKSRALNGTYENPLKARLIDVGDSKSDDDVALLKIDSKVENLQIFNISSKSQKINENLHIYGYPGDKIEKLENQSRIKNKSVSSSIYTPSLTSGHLTAKTPNSQGTLYYETNAVTSEGYSGGPVVDDKNRVIGILIYGLYKKNGSKKETGNGSLFLSSNHIIKICKKNKVPINVV
jgi:S1-C subfamily serine protease